MTKKLKVYLEFLEWFDYCLLQKGKNAPLQKGPLLTNSTAPELLSTHSDFYFTMPLHINIYPNTYLYNRP